MKQDQFPLATHKTTSQCLVSLLTSSLSDSDPGYPVLIQSKDFLFTLITSPKLLRK